MRKDIFGGCYELGSRGWRVGKSVRLAAMKRASNLIVWPVLMLLLATSVGCSREEPGVEIPLNKIWAWKMPGTQDIKTLEPKHFGPTVRKLPEQEQVDLLLSSLSQQIDFAIGRQTDEKQPIGPGFAVAGTGHKALASVKEAMEQDQMPSQTFTFGTDISLFFFTRSSGWPVQLKSVAKLENTITVQYYFVPHRSNDLIFGRSNRYFALIPLGILPAGSYSVNAFQTIERKYTGRDFQTVDKEAGEKRVCKSFTFTVVQDENEACNSE